MLCSVVAEPHRQDHGVPETLPDPPLRRRRHVSPPPLPHHRRLHRRDLHDLTAPTLRQRITARLFAVVNACISSRI